jgi:hypothetical protein
MDGNSDEDIDRLLERMKEENDKVKEMGKIAKKEEHDDEDESESLHSRYNEKEENSEERSLKKEDEDSPLNPPKTIEKKLEKGKKKIKKAALRHMPHSAKVLNSRINGTKKRKLRKRVATGRKTAGFIPIRSVNKKKQDTVKLYIERSAEWKTNLFLKCNNTESREGRKLNLMKENYVNRFVLSKKRPVQEFIRPAYIPPHEKRRDDLRFEIRTRMMSGSSF